MAQVESAIGPVVSVAVGDGTQDFADVLMTLAVDSGLVSDPTLAPADGDPDATIEVVPN